jgi:hypothetical protein
MGANRWREVGMRDLERRLAALEAKPRPRRPQPLTEAQWELFTALDAAAVALLLGGTDGGPLTRLYRGIEAAFARQDELTPLRACFGERLELATSMALNGCESHARPHHATKQAIRLVQEAGASDLVEAYLGLRDLHPTIRMDSERASFMTFVDRQGNEHYRWPDRVGTETPASGWCGQGIAGAAAYWATPV